MSQSELTQLTKAEELYDAGKLEEALELLNRVIELEELNLQQKGYYQFLKGRILCDHGNYQEIVKFGEDMYKEHRKFEQNLRSVDGLIFILFGLVELEKFEEGFEVIEQAEHLLKSISNKSQKKLLHRKARINVVKGYFNFKKGNSKQAKSCYQWTINLENELGSSFEIVLAHLHMAVWILNIGDDTNKAFEHINKAMSLAKVMRFNHFWIAACHLIYGVINSHIGEFEIALDHNMKCCTIFKQINNKWYLSGILNNIGHTYQTIGDYNLALEYLEESFQLWERSPIQLVNCLGNIISIALIKNDIERAQKYFDLLDKLVSKTSDRYYIAMHQYSKALMLKRSSRIRDIAKVQKLLNQIIETENINVTFILDALVHLCDVLFAEFLMTNNIEVLDEINQHLSHLLKIAEKSHSYLYFCETFILQAKLALIKLDMKAARRFLTQAQKIAESHGIIRLAMKISLEHDELLRQLKIWEDFKESKAPLTERWKVARLNEQMEHMIKKQKIDVPELPDEEPVLLLMVSEGGIPFFSQSFIKDKPIEDHLFGGFLTAINSFINEKFSEGLERASFGKHTLLMNSVSPFLMCYVYKGQSYSAQKRITSFINEIQNDKELWEAFKKFYQMNRKIHIEDIPSLEPLIARIFNTKRESIKI
ncbi:MAG: tetratricopeptide repeat protein [Candidatus Odinarchaeota archaeon]